MLLKKLLIEPKGKMIPYLGNLRACEVGDRLALFREKLDCVDEPELSDLLDQAETAWKAFFRAVRERKVRLDRIKNKGRKTKKGETMPRDVTTAESVGERMTTEQLAASAYRVATYAYQKEPLAWGLLAPSDREGWLRVAHEAASDVGGLASLDGLHWDDVAKIVYDVYENRKSEKDNAYPSFPEWRACWQAVSRHLVQLLDEDEIDDLEALEQSWREWAFKRLEKQP